MAPSWPLAFGLFSLPPPLCSVWTEESQCTLLNASITETFNCSFSCGPDCWKLSQYPCLQVYVNLTSSSEKLLLYHTEETMKINQKVGVWPPHTAFLSPRRAPLNSSLSEFSGAIISKKNAARKQALLHPLTELTIRLLPGEHLFSVHVVARSFSHCVVVQIYPLLLFRGVNIMPLFIHKETQCFKANIHLRVRKSQKTGICHALKSRGVKLYFAFPQSLSLSSAT